MWRILQELKTSLSEDQAREYLQVLGSEADVWAVNEVGDIIEDFDGPKTVGRPR
jgi:hypothetical protein